MMALVTPSRLLALLAGIFALELVVLLLLPSRLPTAKGVKAQQTIWELPASVRVESDLALSAINQRRIWGAAGAAGLPAAAAAIEEKPLTPPDWRVAGVFTEAGGYALLVTVDGVFLPQTLHVGDHLPGGAKILAIRNDRISLSLNGRLASLSTYPQ